MHFSSAVWLVLFGRSGRGKRDRALSSLRTLSWSSNYLAVFHCPVKDDTNQEVWLNLELATSMCSHGQWRHEGDIRRRQHGGRARKANKDHKCQAGAVIKLGAARRPGP